MRGFQPAAHLVPKYADGGLVQRALGLFGGRKKQIDEAVKVATSEGARPSAPAPAPVKTTPDGKFDEKRASKDNPAGIGFADGGMVRGPGTGTSDDVPDKVPEGTYIMPADSTQAIGAENLERAGARGLPMPGSKKVPVALSNGEFKMPPEQVHAVGVQALDQIKNATHTPVRGFAPQAAPEQPRQFFANGGNVKRLHLADAGVVTRKRLEEEGQVPNAATSPSNIFPGNRLPGDSGSTSAPPPVAPSTSVGVSSGTLPQEQGDPFLSTPKARAGLAQGQQPTAAPSAPTAPAPADSGGFSYADNNKAVGQGIKESWNKGNYGEAVGKTVAGSVGMFTTPIIDLASRGGAAAWDGAKGFTSGLFGMGDGATPAVTSPTDARLATGAQRAPAGFAPAIKPQAPASASAPVVVQRMAQPPQSPAFDFDNFQPAPGQGAFRNEQTGKVTRLQDGPAPVGTRTWKEPNVLPRSDARPAAQRQEVRAPVLNPNGGVFSSMVDFTNQAGQAVQAIAANKGMRNDRKDALDQQRVGLDAASTFAKIEQGDRALGIDGRRADTAQDLAALQADELGLKREAAGFQTRAAAQQEQLRNVLLDPKSTPEQRAVAQRNLAALSGKTAADRMQTVTLPDTTNEMGMVVRGGQALVRVLEDGTVQQVPIGAQQGAALPPGMKRQIGTSNGRPVYEDMNGKQVIAKG